MIYKKLKILFFLFGFSLIPIHGFTQTTGFALIDAASQGNIALVDTFLKAKANPNVQDRKGFTALMMASMYGNQNMVKLLLRYGANPFLRSQSKHKAIDFAFKNNHPQIVNLLKMAEKNGLKSFK